MSEVPSATEFINKAPEPASTIWSVSIRAWITLALVLTICGAHVAIVIGIVVHAILNKDWTLVGTFANVGEPLYSLSTLAVGFYFGQKVSEKK